MKVTPPGLIAILPFMVSPVQYYILERLITILPFMVSPVQYYILGRLIAILPFLVSPVLHTGEVKPK